MRFHVGEIAVIVGVSLSHCPQSGEEVEIVGIGPYPVGARPSGPPDPRTTGVCAYPDDYEIRDERGFHWFCGERYLRKRRPPIPESVRHVFDVLQGNPDKVGETA